MRGRNHSALQLTLTSAVWFAVLVGTTLAYIGSLDVAFATLGLDARLASVVILALGTLTASAVAWLVWTSLGRDEVAPVRQSLATAAPDPA
jgi:hypothetical protein